MDSIRDKDTSEEQPKKCFCARCFMPIAADDRIDVDGQNFHKCCCMCCVCRQIPRSIKMFYGHVFCPECFNNQVKARFRGEGPRLQSNSWWMITPNTTATAAAKDSKERNVKELEPNHPPKEPVKKCICARCLQAVDNDSKVTIGDQHFHSQCARCYCCRSVPTGNVKIYYGQLFCEECFHRYVMPRNKDNPSEFFKYCFDQWQNNAQVADNMREFMTSNSSERPVIFVPQGCTQSFCRCGNAHQGWFSKPEQVKKSDDYDDCESIIGSWDLDPSVKLAGLHSHQMTESAKQENFNEAEKIEKLTKLIRKKISEKCSKKWKNFDQSKNECVSMSLEPSMYGWVDLQKPMRDINEILCPKCLWQCGPTFVSSDYLKNAVVNSVEFYAE